MSKCVELPDTVFAALEAAATATRMTPAEWIAARLTRPTSRASAPRQAKVLRPRWDEFAGRIGSIDNGLEDLDAVGMAKRRARQPRTHRVTALVCAVDLPDPVYGTLEDAAYGLETTPAGWIAAQVPPTNLASQPESEGARSKPLAERFAESVGGFRSGRGDFADRHSELFTEGMMEKRAGRIAAGVSDSESADVPDDRNSHTLAERLEGLIGVVSLERSDLAERHGELFAEGMAEKHRRSRL